MSAESPERTVVVGCAALARELRTALAGLPVEVVLLPAPLHNRPALIPAAVDEALTAHVRPGDRAVVAYADCGTGGLLDPVVARHGAVRLPGAHCYEVIASPQAFEAMTEEDLGTFFLSEFLLRHFDALVVAGLGLDRHPELRDLYFGHYHRVMVLLTEPSEELEALGRQAAQRLGLAYEATVVGHGPFRRALLPLVSGDDT